MDLWLLITATLLATVGGAAGMLSVHRGIRSRWTILWMIGTLACQMGFLGLRGQLRGTCPLQDITEILAFIAWAITLFYLLVGPAYRLSLLGVFSAPLVVVFQSAALLSMLWVPTPAYVGGSGLYHALHSATSVLAYGALGLAAIAGIMFLTLDRQLKDQVLRSGLFRNLPPARDLLVSLERLIWAGTLILTFGILTALMMPAANRAHSHFLVAIAVWISYSGLLAVKSFRGLTGRKLALSVVVLFFLSLMVFASV